MDISTATRALAALSQESRLEAFRLLIEEGEAGLPAGRVASEVGVPHNTMSSHLATLEQSGLVSSKRQGRSIIYRANMTALKALLSYLIQDCCHGRPEKCASMLDDLLPSFEESA